MTSTNTTQRPQAGEATAARAVIRRLLGGMFWDVGLAVLAYYGARAAGASDYTALLAGTLTAGARVLWVAVRDRRLDPFAGFLLVLFGTGLALTLVTGDARFLLAKDSITTGLAGLLILGSCLIRRPLCYYAAQRMAGPDRAAELRARTDANPGVRRQWYRLSAIWGAGLLVEALLRVVLIYLLPISVAVGASAALMIAAYGALIGWTIHVAKRGERRRREATTSLS